MTKYYIAEQGILSNKARNRTAFFKGAAEFREPKSAYAIDGYYKDKDTEDIHLFEAFTKGTIKLGGKISVDRHVMAGTPVIRGTRIPVFLILDYLGEGYTPEEIIVDYPHLTRENIRDAIKFASAVIDAHEDE